MHRVHERLHRLRAVGTVRRPGRASGRGRALILRRPAAHPAQTEAFFAQGVSVKRLWNAAAVSPSAPGSPVALYFETPAQ